MKILLSLLLSLLFSLAITISSTATDYVESYVVPNKVIQYDARTFLGMDGYFSTQNLVSQQLSDEKLSKIEEQLSELANLLKEISSKLGNNGNPSNPSDNPTNDNPDSDNGDNNSDGDEETPTPTDENGITELDVKVYNIFSDKCANCHGKEDSDGGLRLIDKDNDALFYQDLDSRVNIFDRTYGVGLAERGLVRMPKGGQLSDEEVETLRLWMIEEAGK